jgi:predicted small lipoprotein YifL
VSIDAPEDDGCRRRRGDPSEPWDRRACLPLLLCAGLALAGCGRKGDLYLPRDARKPAKPGEEEAPEPATTDDIPEDFYDQ